MRIGLIAPPWVPVPPPAYGGTEVVIDNLARGLRRRGHEVRLFTVGTSTCSVPRRHLYRVPAEPMGESCHEAAHVLAAYDEMRDVDVVHDHTLLGPLVASATGRARRPPGQPLVVTAHGPFDAETRRIFGVATRRAALVAISHAQARNAAPLPVAAVIHHGIDLDTYAPGPGGGGYLLFIGRMSPDKGVHRALRVAHRAGMPLVIVSKMREQSERSYFEERVAPVLGPADDLVGECSLTERLELLRFAEGLLNPVGWPEPFGLVMAEALAAGVPVLACPHGAAPEIVDSGRTGFLCEDEQAMVEAVARLGEIDRVACRVAAEQRFGMDRMACDHVALYQSLLAGSPIDAHPQRMAHHRRGTAPLAGGARHRTRSRQR